MTTDNRCGKADLVEHELGCVYTSQYQAARICCWLLAYVEPARNFTAPSLRNIEASSEGKTCAMREARSSSSPKAAAISFTSSAYSTWYLRVVIALYPADDHGNPLPPVWKQCSSPSQLSNHSRRLQLEKPVWRLHLCRRSTIVHTKISTTYLSTCPVPRNDARITLL
jgi:hypothetical protein